MAGSRPKPRRRPGATVTACGKIGYRDRIAALTALAGTGAKDGSRREKSEKRAYRCPACRKWHLTSKRGRGKD